MNIPSFVMAAVAALSLTSAASAALEITSTINSTYPATVTDVVNGSTATGSGWGYQSGEQFVDYFNENDTIEWTNVNFGTPGAGSVLATQSRVGQPGRSVQGYKVEFFTPGTGFTTPVQTLVSERYRQTTYGPGAWVCAPVQGFNLTGTYDVRITNQNAGNNPNYSADAGSHFRGLVMLNSNYQLAQGSNVFQSESFSWGSGGKSARAQEANSVGTFLDNQITGNGSWIDYEVFNPFATASASFTAFYRHGMGSNVALNLQTVDADGDVSGIVASTMLPNSDWGAQFQTSAASGTFTLAQGLNVLRLYSDSPIHLDSIALDVIPEPSTYAIMAGVVAMLIVAVRRRKR
ncbi:MAG: PEP-CTERM sorting domain-containing protein [Verrucomicrobiota bacterium]|nr:PEP-CTERM sorting domain-containing protein [Verrucomicrobiota bacterium]